MSRRVRDTAPVRPVSGSCLLSRNVGKWVVSAFSLGREPASVSSCLKTDPIVARCSHLTFSPNSSTHLLTEIECLSMADQVADAPGKFIITSGTRPFRARPIRSILTHCSQDLSTRLIPPSYNCSMISLIFLHLILVAFNLCLLWPQIDTSDTDCHIRGKTSTRKLSISPK